MCLPSIFHVDTSSEYSGYKFPDDLILPQF